MKTALILGACLLSGCTINMVDKRLQREEVQASFAQISHAIEVDRAAIKDIAVEIKAMKDGKASKPKEK